MAERVPVIVLTGHLGAGKTTVLNHLLRRPRTRIGVVVNDFGTVNLDATLVSGYVDQPAAISGGCLCCIDDLSGLDLALERLASLDLDAILIEASGLADPMVLARMVRSMSRRPGPIGSRAASMSPSDGGRAATWSISSGGASTSPPHPAATASPGAWSPSGCTSTRTRPRPGCAASSSQGPLRSATGSDASADTCASAPDGRGRLNRCR